MMDGVYVIFKVVFQMIEVIISKEEGGCRSFFKQTISITSAVLFSKKLADPNFLHPFLFSFWGSNPFFYVGKVLPEYGHMETEKTFM